MAINQTKIFDDLEKLAKKASENEFIFEFLKIFEFPKATITRMKKEDNPLNVAEDKIAGGVAIKQVLYFKPIKKGLDVYDELEALKSSSVVKTNKIRFCIVTDYEDFAAYDFRYDDTLECSYQDVYKNYTFFLPLVNVERTREFIESFADVKASEKMGRLFDAIKLINNFNTPEEIHSLNVFMSRLLFCFFAEDTDIFEKNLFTNTLENNTNKNGDNFTEELSKIFVMMNENGESKLRKNAATHVAKFPYVNGGLFESNFKIPLFTKRTRRILLECGKLDWSEINPDIFGSMFQAVIDPKQRRNHGQHYTSVPNIMKVTQPLFVEPLERELNQILERIDLNKRLKALHEYSMRLGEIKFFDPACGSGNFLIISYKELRRIEMNVFRALKEIDSNSIFYSVISLNQFYGIELDDFAHEVAVLSLWLAEHQMNVQFRSLFGDCTPTLPLKNSGTIICANSLLVDWDQVVPRKDKDDEVYIIGNPPFGGSGNRTEDQTNDMALVFSSFKQFKFLDYVTCWFWKGAQYIQGTKAKLALVSTNSISQGDQVAMLWPQIFSLGVEIHIAYQTFPWKNNAKKNAGVHVVIIGLSGEFVSNKEIYTVIDSDTHKHKTINISPYLIEGSNLCIEGRSEPLSNVPRMIYGNKPVDGGNLILTSDEKNQLVLANPSSKNWIKKLIGAEELINGKERWCLWLVGITESELNEMPLVKARVNAVRKMRLKSKDSGANKMAETAHLFRENYNPEEFIVVPCHSSERRAYLPLGYLDKSYITTNANLFIPNGGMYELGILMSEIHNDWMRVVCGRLESRYRYSASVVYNCFPWPEASDKQKKTIEQLAEEILLIRADFPDKTLGELYDPDEMPESLKLAHENLDRAVDKLYRTKPFNSSSDRVSHLFELYNEYVNN